MQQLGLWYYLWSQCCSVLTSSKSVCLLVKLKCPALLVLAPGSRGCPQHTLVLVSDPCSETMRYVDKREWRRRCWWALLLGGQLLAQRCRTDDLLPSIFIFCLPACRMDPKVLRLNMLINCSQPGGSWSSNWSSPVCWWS